MLRIINHYIYKPGFMLFPIEGIILTASFYFGVAVRFFHSGLPFFPAFSNLLPQAGIFAAVMILSMKALGMYHLTFREDFRHTLLLLMPSFAMGFGLITLIVYIAPDVYFGRGILGLVMLFAATGILSVRFIIGKASNHKFVKPHIMVLGTGELASECANIAEHNDRHHEFNIVGFVAAKGENPVVPFPSILPSYKSLLALATAYRVDEIVVAVQNQDSNSFSIHELLECKLNGVNIIDSSTFFEREMSQIRVNSLNPNWLVFGGGFDQSGLRTAIKRTFDLFASTTLLIITLPVMLITALCIYLQDRAPVFYRQERIGLEGRPFSLLKFRSMRHDAETRGKPKWAAEHDPRITRVGRIIRKLRIDELPQIVNVLRGEMSMVGPRPEREYFIKQLSKKIPYYNVRHIIKPGITGWAQVRYQYGSSVEDSVQKLQYDLYYVKNNSLYLDIIILIDTVQVVLTGRGGR